MPTKFNLSALPTISKDTSMYKKIPRNFPTRSVYVPRINHTVAIDLMDYSKQPKRGNHYVMVAVDVYSRKAFTTILKSKNIADLKKGINIIFNKLSDKPLKVWVDGESGIHSHEMREFFDSKNIEIYQTFGRVHNPIVERLIRTLKEIMEKGNLPWNFVEKATQLYNSTEHGTTKSTPDYAYSRNPLYISKIYKDKTNENKNSKNTYEEGDKVRVRIKKGTFTKGFKPTFSDEKYIISKVLMTNPTTYKLSTENGYEIKGSYYEQEITS